MSEWAEGQRKGPVKEVIVWLKDGVLRVGTLESGVRFSIRCVTGDDCVAVGSRKVNGLCWKILLLYNLLRWKF